MKFVLKKDSLEIKDREQINSGSINHYLANVEFDEYWEKLTIEAIIVEKDKLAGKRVAVIEKMVSIDNISSGNFFIGFVGFNVKYFLTSDTEINVEKKYFIKDEFENEEKYVIVKEPNIEDISKYYEAEKEYQISSNLKKIPYNKGAGEIKTEEEELPKIDEWEIYVSQIKEIIKSVNSIPLGGTTGQVLTKKSDRDYDYEWKDQEGGGGLGVEEDPTVPEHVKEIKKEDINKWNNKSNFSGKYEDLSGKPKIPTSVSELNNDKNYLSEESDPTIPQYIKNIKENDISKWNNKAEKSEIPDTSEFITNSVNDLLNYYLKSETYSKEEVKNLIGQIKTINIQKVNELPEVGETNIIYLVPKEGSDNDVHNEYIYINNSWELIGSTQIDLTGYATENWVNIQIKDFLNTTQVNNLITVALLDYYTKEQIDYLLINKADSTDIPTKLSDLNNDKKYQTETEVQALINNAIGTALAGEY